MSAWSPSLDAPKGVIRALVSAAMPRPARRFLVLEGLPTRQRGCWWRYVAGVDDLDAVQRLREVGAVDERLGVAVVFRDDLNTELLDDATGERVWSSVPPAVEATEADRRELRNARARTKRRPFNERADLLREAVRDEMGRRAALGMRPLTSKSYFGEALQARAAELGMGDMDISRAVAAIRKR